MYELIETHLHCMTKPCGRSQQPSLTWLRPGVPFWFGFLFLHNAWWYAYSWQQERLRAIQLVEHDVRRTGWKRGTSMVAESWLMSHWDTSTTIIANAVPDNCDGLPVLMQKSFHFSLRSGRCYENNRRKSWRQVTTTHFSSLQWPFPCQARSFFSTSDRTLRLPKCVENQSAYSRRWRVLSIGHVYLVARNEFVQLGMH